MGVWNTFIIIVVFIAHLASQRLETELKNEVDFILVIDRSPPAIANWTPSQEMFDTSIHTEMLHQWVQCMVKKLLWDASRSRVYRMSARVVVLMLDRNNDTIAVEGEYYSRIGGFSSDVPTMPALRFAYVQSYPFDAVDFERIKRNVSEAIAAMKRADRKGVTEIVIWHVPYDGDDPVHVHHWLQMHRPTADMMVALPKYWINADYYVFWHFDVIVAHPLAEKAYSTKAMMMPSVQSVSGADQLFTDAWALFNYCLTEMKYEYVPCHYSRNGACVMQKVYIPRGEGHILKYCRNRTEEMHCSHGQWECDRLCTDASDEGPCSATCGQGMKTLRPRNSTDEMIKYCKLVNVPCNLTPCGQTVGNETSQAGVMAPWKVTAIVISTTVVLAGAVVITAWRVGRKRRLLLNQCRTMVPIAIGRTQFLEGIEDLLSGKRLLLPYEKPLVVEHEAGHCVAAWNLEHGDPIHKVSIVPCDSCLGNTNFLALQRNLYTSDQLSDELCVLYGGLVAEKLFHKSFTSGSKVDMLQANQLARKMVTAYGMGDTVGAGTAPAVDTILSEYKKEQIEKDIDVMLKTAEERTTKLLEQRKHEIKKVADELVQRDTLMYEDIEKILGQRRFPSATPAGISAPVPPRMSSGLVCSFSMNNSAAEEQPDINENRGVIDQFIEVTGVERNRARFYLNSAAFDISLALSAFFEGDPDDIEELVPEVIYDRAGSDANEVQVIEQPSTRQTRATEPKESEEMSGPSGAGKSGEGQKKKIATLFSQGGPNAPGSGSESDEEGEKGQAFYVGGSEKSGQQVLGPPKKKGDTFVEKFFQQARERGAEQIDASQRAEASAGSSGSNAFGGAGYRLGDTVKPAEKLGGMDVDESSAEPAVVTVVMRMWRNGFTIDDEPLRTLDGDADRQFLQHIMQGRLPPELLQAHRGKKIDLEMEDHRHEDYKPQKRALKAFTGQGHTLGRMRPDLADREFVTSFPSKELTNEMTTLEEANLLNPVIIQSFK